MIKSIRLQNFQSHRKSILKFKKGLNVISGKSDSGKSSIKRAIEWLIKNKPLGDSFRSHWGGKTSVVLKTDKDIIKRIKGKSNTYHLNDKRFIAFGCDVPSEIRNSLRFSDIGIQSQFDPHFLFSSSSGEISRFINKIININIIDTSINNINKIIKREKSELEKIKISLSQKKEEKKKYKWIKYAKQDILKLETENSRLKEEEERVSTVEQLLISFEQNLKKYRRINKLASVENTNLHKRITELYKRIKKNQVVLVNISDLIASVEVLRRNLAFLNIKLDENKQNLSKMLKICPLCGRKG